MVDQLDAQYAKEGKPVIFVEHNVDDCRQGQPCVGSSERAQIFRLANPSANILPLMMSDSGAKTRFGSSQDWQRDLKAMIDPELRRMEQVDIQAYFQRSGNTAKVQAIVTNKSGRTLASADRAQVWVVLYEDKKVIHTNRYVRAVKSTLINPDLENGATGTYNLEVAGTGGMNWAKAHIAVMVDMRKPGGGIFDMMQAAIAVEGEPPAPTEPPTPTDLPPTETATPTEPPPATTEVPSPTATESPTEPPPGGKAFLPAVYYNVGLDR